jgi:outer membrane protein assembly factor BamB
MWFRSAAILGLVFALNQIGTADVPRVYSRAMPPDRAQLDRLNLRQEWSLYLPLASQRDSIQSVQTIDDQLFIQTRTGLLIAVDALTGKIQWTAALGNGGYGNVYPVAANAKFVFAAHVTRLYAFYRYSGVVEFTTDLGTPPTAGLTADDDSVYATLMTRAGASGVERIAAYTLPNPINVPDPARIAAMNPADKEKFSKTLNPVDDLVNRYPVAGVPRGLHSNEIERSRGRVREAPVGGMAGSRSPSLAVTTQVTPPYIREGEPPVVSLVVMPSLRQPYHLREESQRNIQRTPSISTIPPSVAAALSLADLRPRGVEPKLRWEFGMTRGVSFRLTQTPSRVWAVTEGRGLIALSKLNKTIEVSGTTFEQVAAAPSQAGTTAYAPLGDGTLIAVDLATGNRDGGLNIYWKANVGGIMNRTPIVADDAVFAAGDNSGVARVDRKTGDVKWRTDDAADRVVALSNNFLYVQDRQGRLLVFDAERANGTKAGRSAPLASMDMSAFNVPIVNTVNDRLYFAADNGLLVCLRDMSKNAGRLAPGASISGLADPPKSVLDTLLKLDDGEMDKLTPLAKAVQILVTNKGLPEAGAVFIPAFTKLTDKEAMKQLGPPTETFKTTNGGTMIRYGWLAFDYDSKGVLIAVGRAYQLVGPGDFGKVAVFNPKP